MSEANDKKINKDKVLETIKGMVDFMNVNCEFDAREEMSDGRDKGSLVISIKTSDGAPFLIGKNGQNLKAMEHLVRAVVAKDGKEGTVVLDINDYRKSRVSHLIDVAKEVVSRVRNTQKAEALPPMSSYERRLVHMELAAYPDVATESIGAEPQRRVIIKPYP